MTRSISIALVAAAPFGRAPAAFAQAETPAPSSAKKLAEEFNDPLTTLPQLFLQNAYTYRQDAPIAPQTTVRLGANISFPELKLWQGF